MKIGYSVDPAARLQIANYDGWGGCHDWHLSAYVWSERAGKLEHELQSAFSHLKVALPWVRNGKPQVTDESFSHDVTAVIEKMVWLADEIPTIVSPI
jgi:hypothetical protein